MSDIDLTPVKSEANIVRVPGYKPFEITLNFDNVIHAIKAGISMKAMAMAAFLSMAEERRDSFPTLEDLEEMTSAAYPGLWIKQGLAELMQRNLAFWYEDEDGIHYILSADFSAVI